VKSNLYPETGRIATPHLKRRLCCAVCGWPREYAVHLPPADAPSDAPAYDHEFVTVEHLGGQS